MNHLGEMTSPLSPAHDSAHVNDLARDDVDSIGVTGISGLPPENVDDVRALSTSHDEPVTHDDISPSSLVDSEGDVDAEVIDSGRTEGSGFDGSTRPVDGGDEAGTVVSNADLTLPPLPPDAADDSSAKSDQTASILHPETEKKLSTLRSLGGSKFAERLKKRHTTAVEDGKDGVVWSSSERPTHGDVGDVGDAPDHHHLGDDVERKVEHFYKLQAMKTLLQSDRKPNGDESTLLKISSAGVEESKVRGAFLVDLCARGFCDQASQLGHVMHSDIFFSSGISSVYWRVKNYVACALVCMGICLRACLRACLCACLCAC